MASFERAVNRNNKLWVRIEVRKNFVQDKAYLHPDQLLHKI